MWEKELLGLFVSNHPLKSLKSQLKLEQGLIAIKDIASKTGSLKIGGMITRIQKIVTKTGKPMLFSQVEDLSSKIEVVVFPNVLEKNPDAWQENNVVVVRGKLNERDGTAKLLCDDVKAIVTFASPTPTAVVQ